jgi:hypothetical protein
MLAERMVEKWVAQLDVRKDGSKAEQLVFSTVDLLGRKKDAN